MEPCTTNNVSLAKGWVWGGMTPPIPKSSPTWEMPSVLRAGYSKTALNVGYAFVPVTETFPEIKPNAGKERFNRIEISGRSFKLSNS